MATAEMVKSCKEKELSGVPIEAWNNDVALVDFKIGNG